MNCGLVSGKLGLRREGDPPEILHSAVSKKLDPIGIESLNCAHLGDDAGRSLSTATVLYHDCGTDYQLAVQLDRCSVFIQVGCSGGHREGAFLAILTCQTYAGAERHAAAAALRYLNAINS